jgi:hypothetical protein
VKHTPHIPRCAEGCKQMIGSGTQELFCVMFVSWFLCPIRTKKAAKQVFVHNKSFYFTVQKIQKINTETEG